LQASGFQDRVSVHPGDEIVASLVLGPPVVQRADLAVNVAVHLDDRDTTVAACDLRGIVRAVVGYDHDPIGGTALVQHRLERASNGSFLVVRRDEDQHLLGPDGRRLTRADQ
jgi:hypothetical protein